MLSSHLLNISQHPHPPPSGRHEQGSLIVRALALPALIILTVNLLPPPPPLSAQPRAAADSQHPPLVPSGTHLSLEGALSHRTWPRLALLQSTAAHALAPSPTANLRLKSPDSTPEAREASIYAPIYKHMKRRAIHTYAWLGFFATYHSLAVIERSYFLATHQPLLGSGYFVKSTTDQDAFNYQRYVTPLNLSLDILSLLALAAQPYAATLQFVDYYENSADNLPDKEDQLQTLLRQAAREQRSPRSLKSHLIRMGFHASYALLIAFDYGDQHRAINYFISGFIGGQIKSYLAPHYAPRLLQSTLAKTSLFIDSVQPRTPSHAADYSGRTTPLLVGGQQRELLAATPKAPLPIRLSIYYQL